MILKEIIKQDKTIFTYLNPEANDRLTTLNKNDLQELLNYLDRYYLELRKKINIDKNITFGVEIEHENAMRKAIQMNLKKKPWSYENDFSLFLGGEAISPILTDKIETWKEIKSVCEIIKNSALIGTNSSAHVHVGFDIMDDEDIIFNFLNLWSSYENIIFRFCYGEYLTERPYIERYAEPNGIFFETLYDCYFDTGITKEKLLKYLKIIRNRAVNFRNANSKEKNTIEFRSPNGTLNPIIWQNNINLFVKMIEYCKSNNYKEQPRRCTDNLMLYRQIYLEQAFEFADLIFDNNLDKIYFLKQYLKNYEVGSVPCQKAKRMTK